MHRRLTSGGRVLVAAVAVVAALAGFALAACSGGGSKSSSAAATGISTPSTVQATGGGAFCTKIAAAYNDGVAELPKVVQGGSVTPDLKATFQKAHAEAQAAVAAAPTDVKADVLVLGNAFETFYTAFAAVNFDPTKLNPGVLETVGSAQVQQAVAHVTTYVKQHCGISLG